MFLSPDDYSTLTFWGACLGLGTFTVIYFFQIFIHSIGFWPFLVLVVAECWIGLANVRRLVKRNPAFGGYRMGEPGQRQLSHSIRNSLLFLCVLICHSVLLFFLWRHFSTSQDSGIFMQTLFFTLLNPTLLFVIFAFVGVSRKA